MDMIMKRLRTTELTLIGLCTAIICILAPMSFPVPFSPVPVTLGLFSVILIGAILGSRHGLICISVYILIGFVGLPVFSNYGSGAAKVFGPTGGYLLGYLFLVWCVGFAAERFSRRIVAYFLGALVGIVICYFFGSLWLAVQMKLSLGQAFAVGVLPFIVPDLIKMLVAVVLAYMVKMRLVAGNLLQEP